MAAWIDTLVNTIEGPQNTSSSSSTPFVDRTLFCTLTLLPSRVPPMTTTFCPRLHRSPITAPGITWQKCQICVPAPTVAPSSTYADSWIAAAEDSLRPSAPWHVRPLGHWPSGGATAGRGGLVGRRREPAPATPGGTAPLAARPQARIASHAALAADERGRVRHPVRDRRLPQRVVVSVRVLA